MESIWKNSVIMPKFPQAEGKMSTDVLIVGGGLAGILCAYFLQENGVDYILAEGKTIGGGNTKNTTAKITLQHRLIYHKLLEKNGVDYALQYLKANQQATEQYEKLCQTINCDYETKSSYVYSMADYEILEKEAEALSRLGYECFLSKKTELPFPVAGAIRIDNQAQFHPMKFIAAIAKDLNIYENAFVKEMKENVAILEKGSIKFQKVIFATHFPMVNKHGMYFLKMYQNRSYVLALKGAERMEGMYVDEAPQGLSFRSYKDMLLLGGGAGRTGKTCGGWDELRKFVKRYMLKPQLCINGFEAMKNILRISPKRCPHLGCSLTWNCIEHSWDCPCHGSRFDEKGKVLDNPANGDMRQ